MQKIQTMVLGLSAIMGAGCIDLGEQTLLPTGTPFVVTGTAAVVDVDGQPCRVWIGDNGVTYHLFQDPLLENAIFDEITTPDTVSRLVIVTRADLVVTCEMGTTAEVEEVLEIQP